IATPDQGPLASTPTTKSPPSGWANATIVWPMSAAISRRSRGARPIPPRALELDVVRLPGGGQRLDDGGRIFGRGAHGGLTLLAGLAAWQRHGAGRSPDRRHDQSANAKIAWRSSRS